MNIAIIHYHLKTGGVTTVIKQHINAIKDDCDVLVLTGLKPEAPFPAETAHICGLAYNNNNEDNIEPQITADAIIKALYTKWPEGCDVVHVHNPTLAKNKNFLKILEILKQTCNLFLQIHDFAEDGRPLAYFKDEYPSDCHYGVINSRDFGYLLDSGLDKQGLHFIPNTVTPLKDLVPPDKMEPRILYPVRAIRRKNIGEAILLSLFVKEKEIAITQPPNSISDFIPYNAWKAFVKQNKLNVTFEAGLKKDFRSLVLSSESMVTTSITEGFGLSFLEPWLADKLLWGRKLADICSDFELNHINLDHLYNKILIPINLINIDRLRILWTRCVLRNCRRFLYAIDTNEVGNAFEMVTRNNTIDYGLLNESFQKEVISSLLSDKSLINKFFELNPFLTNPGQVNDKFFLIERNRNAVKESYVNDNMKNRLLEIYRAVKATPVLHTINKDKIFNRFLNLQNFSLLKWGKYGEQ